MRDEGGAVVTPERVREKYTQILAACEEQVTSSLRVHAHYAHEDISKLYERVFGAYELAMMCGIDPGESPSAWADRVAEQIRRAA